MNFIHIDARIQTAVETDPLYITAFNDAKRALAVAKIDEEAAAKADESNNKEAADKAHKTAYFSAVASLNASKIALDVAIKAIKTASNNP